MRPEKDRRGLRVDSHWTKTSATVTALICLDSASAVAPPAPVLDTHWRLTRPAAVSVVANPTGNVAPLARPSVCGTSFSSCTPETTPNPVGLDRAHRTGTREDPRFITPS